MKIFVLFAILSLCFLIIVPWLISLQASSILQQCIAASLHIGIVSQVRLDSVVRRVAEGGLAAGNGTGQAFLPRLDDKKLNDSGTF
jgi:hypothetical protein